MECKIKIIVALNEKYYIGKDNKLMWHIPDDLKLFKNKTKGKIVVMGRNTYESIGKPLPDRMNIVISRDEDFIGNLNAEDIFINNTLRFYFDIDQLIERLEELPKDTEVFIIGGKSLYQQFLDRGLVDEMYISHIYDSQKGDVRFPFINWKEWKIMQKKKYDRFVFKKYKKIVDK